MVETQWRCPDGVDREALGIKPMPHDLSRRYPGHAERVDGHAERVRVHFEANPHEEGAESVCDLWGQKGRQACPRSGANGKYLRPPQRMPRR